jgi:hypothetical protein
MALPGDTGGIAEALALITERKRELDRLDDEYLALIARAEDALRALGIGLRFSTLMWSGPVEGASVEEAQFLAFDKIAGVWRLAIEHGVSTGDPEDWTLTPLASADRDTRFIAVADGHLEKLIHAALVAQDAAIARRAAGLAPSQARIATLEAARPARTQKGSKP